MLHFGRSKHRLECITADFLPFEQQLHIVVADADMNLQILQFDPDRKSILIHFRPMFLTRLKNDLLTQYNRSKVNNRNAPPTQINLPHGPLPRNNAPPSITPRSTNTNLPLRNNLHGHISRHPPSTSPSSSPNHTIRRPRPHYPSIRVHLPSALGPDHALANHIRFTVWTQQQIVQNG